MSLQLSEDVQGYYFRRHLMHIAALVTATFVTYDTLLTLPEAYRYVLRRKGWSFAKAIFLANAILTPTLLGYSLFYYFSPTPNIKFCFVHGTILVTISGIPPVLITVLLIVRTWAILNKSMYALSALVVTCIAISLGALSYYFFTWGKAFDEDSFDIFVNVSLAFDVLSGNSSIPRDTYWVLNTCYATGVTPSFSVIMGGCLLYESLLMFILLWQRRRNRPVSPTMSMVYALSIKYYLLLLLCLSVAIAGCYINDISRAIVASHFTVGVQSVIASHMIIGLCKCFDNKQFLKASSKVDPYSSRSEKTDGTSTAIVFARPTGSSGSHVGDSTASHTANQLACAYEAGTQGHARKLSLRWTSR